jgi:hypothetical protein
MPIIVDGEVIPESLIHAPFASPNRRLLVHRRPAFSASFRRAFQNSRRFRAAWANLTLEIPTHGNSGDPIPGSAVSVLSFSCTDVESKDIGTHL